MIQKFSVRVEYRECGDLFLTGSLGGDAAKERERLCRNPRCCSLSLAHTAPLLNQIQYSSLVLAFCFAAWSLRYSHDGAALGLVLAEGRGEEVCLAGQMEESLREAADRAGFIGRLEFVHAGQSCGTENTVYAFLWCEGWTFQVSLCSELLGKGQTLQFQEKKYVYEQQVVKQGAISVSNQSRQEKHTKQETVVMEQTCSWEMGVCFWLDNSIRVHTSVRRSVLQPISKIRVLGQKSWISAFHCKEK